MKKMIIALGLIISVVFIFFLLSGSGASESRTRQGYGYEVITVDGQKFLIVSPNGGFSGVPAVAAFPK